MTVASFDKWLKGIFDLFLLQEEEFVKDCLGPRPVSVDEFKLRDRAIHVYSEASRVWKYKQICDEKEPNALEVRR